MAIASKALAQDNDLLAGNLEKPLETNDFLGKLDLSLPESTLFSLMGGSTDGVIRPRSNERLSVHLLPVAGDILSGDGFAFGIEFNVGMRMLPTSYTAGELAGKANELDPESAARVAQIDAARKLARLSVSLAASRATTGAEIESYGLGLAYNYDSAEPLESQGRFEKCVVEAYGPAKELESTSVARRERQIVSEGIWEREFLESWREEHGEDATGPTPTELDNALKAYLDNNEDVQKLRKQGAEVAAKCKNVVNRWNRLIAGGGIAAYHAKAMADMTPANTAEGDQPDMSAILLGDETEATALAAWVGVSAPFGRDGQVTASLKHTDNGLRQRTVDEGVITERWDGSSAGLRYTHGFTDNKLTDGSLRGFVEFAYTEEQFGEIDDKFSQAGVGVELQVTDGVYLQAIVGDTFDSEIDRNNYFSGQLKWGLTGGPAQ